MPSGSIASTASDIDDAAHHEGLRDVETFMRMNAISQACWDPNSPRQSSSIARIVGVRASAARLRRLGAVGVAACLLACGPAQVSPSDERNNASAPGVEADTDSHEAMSPDATDTSSESNGRLNTDEHDDVAKQPEVATPPSPPSTPTTMDELLRQASEAQRSKDDARLIEILRALVELAPSHAGLRGYLAGALAQSGDLDSALTGLEAIAELQGVMALESLTYLDQLRAHDPARCKTLEQRLKDNAAPVGKWTTLHELKAYRELAPEGIEYDATRERLLIGSIDQRRIIEIDRKGKVREWVGADQRLLPVLGIRVDAERGLLWVATADESNGASELVSVELESGAVRDRIAAPQTVAAGKRANWHLLNDIAMRRDGGLLITDSDAGCIYEREQGASALAPVLCDPKLEFPNGVVLSDDERLAYVAWAGGIAVVDLETRTWSAIVVPPSVNVTGIDGLYRRGDDLLAVQNGAMLNRVAAFRIAPDGRGVTSQRVLIANPPAERLLTTAALHNADIWLLHFSPWELPHDKWLAPRVLHVKWPVE